MWLELAHPEIATISCEDCLTYWYDEGAKCVTRPPKSNDPADRLKRPKGSLAPCDRCPKVPTGKPPNPSSAVELDERNRECWEHYKRCRAVYWNVPDALDPLVEQHAAIIHEVEDAVERNSADTGLLTLGRLFRNKNG